MKLKLQSILTVWAILLLPLAVFSQRTISGVVSDAESGETLIGANILVEGTEVGTITDIDGSYTIELPAGATKLQISYTGYAMQVLEVGASNTLDVQMSSGEILNEVVVIGYGTVKREDATGAVQAVSTKDFNRGMITGPQELLAGKVAGVVITPSADPGGGAAIRIRGGSSLSASNDPLIVVDGIPLDNGGVSGSRNPLNIINPNDIETFTVLKDASATAIYGSRASNGVILITTKKGKVTDPFRVDYAGNISFSNIINQVDVLGADEFRSLVATQFGAESQAASLLGDANTDWQDEIYETAVGTDHNISFSGTQGEFLPYRISFGLTNKNGVLLDDRFRRMTGSLNLSPQLLDNRLQINVNIKGSTSTNNFANRAAIGSAVVFDPTQPVRSGNEAYGGYYTWVQNNGDPNVLAPANPLALLDFRNDRSNVDRFIANGSIDYRFAFLPELRANLNLGFDLSNGEGRIDVPGFASFEFDRANGGGVDNQYQQKKENSLLEFYLNYVKEIGASKLDVMGGYSWQRFFFEDNFFNSNIAQTEITEGENTGELYLLSLFGRVNYSAFDRLLLTFTLRGDATSRFSPDSRWGLFPAAAAAYKVVTNSTGLLSNLKLRVGYGVTGQQEVGSYYTYLPRYLTSFDNARYQFGNEYIFTLRPEGYDEEIKWEETTTYNFGVDYGFLNDRINGSIELYQRETKDLLNFIPVPAGTNLTNFINTNVGNLENRGVEFSINLSPIRTATTTWDFGFNVAYNENEITRLTATDDPDYDGVLTGGISGGVGSTVQIHSVGFPASSYYLYEQVYDDEGVPVEGLYVDRDGNGVINPDDLYRPENPAPDYAFGFTSNFTHKNWDFSFAGRANLGNYNYNNVLSNTTALTSLYHPTNYLLNQHAQITAIDFQNPQYLSDHFLQNASFLRIDHITLGYNFNAEGKGYNSLRAFATVQNPILITEYDGIDPEIFGGIDNNIYPRSRTFVFGLNASF
ncbi:MAG: SusC/RagA family TonB-linked outer membrane protein [Bacteroidota bacterium]